MRLCPKSPVWLGVILRSADHTKVSALRNANTAQRYDWDILILRPSKYDVGPSWNVDWSCLARGLGIAGEYP